MPLSPTPRPNFLIIIADDLGYTDLSCFGSEIQTPHIDSIARDGSQMTDFHTAAACSPTRSMLLTGTDNHIAGLGQLNEFIRSSAPHQGKPGHEGYLNDKVVTMAELLSDDGYQTFLSGKWHLGLTLDTAPSARGFQRTYSLLPGCANHYGYEPQLEERIPRFFETAVAALHEEDGKYVKELPVDFYSTDAYTDKMVNYLDTRDRDRPFLGYLAFSAPHWPLQSSKTDRERYRGNYDDGPDALRRKRLDRLKKLGLIAKDVDAWPVVINEVKPWNAMTDLERAKSSKAMETYAGMVTSLDRGVGRVLDTLKRNGDYDNTVILFMSDNGAEGASYEAIPVMGPNIMAHIEKYYNNSLDNIGEKDSFVWYGARWAAAATAPSRLWKMHPTQGGIKVPAILSGPCIPNRIDDEFCTVMDILPTFLEMAGTKHRKTYRGKQVASIRGESMVPHLVNDSIIHDAEYVTGWELIGQAAIRKGKWKIVWLASPKGLEKWELFDIKNDPGEVHDLSASHPDVMVEMIAHWQQYKEETGSVGLRSEITDDMADDTAWMKYEKQTSWNIAREVRGDSNGI